MSCKRRGCHGAGDQAESFALYAVELRGLARKRRVQLVPADRPTHAPRRRGTRWVVQAQQGGL